MVTWMANFWTRWLRSRRKVSNGCCGRFIASTNPPSISRFSARAEQTNLLRLAYKLGLEARLYLPGHVAELLAPEGDVVVLTGEIVRVLDDDTLWRNLMAKGPEWTRIFSPEKIISRWLKGVGVEGKRA